MNNINQEIKELEATLVSLKAKAEAQEPTLTPVSFKSKGELAKALVDGRTFKTPTGYTIMYGEETRFSSPFRIMRDGKDVDAMRGTWDLYDDLQEINAAPAEPWYLNIPPEGIMCYVSDVDVTPFASPNTSLVTECDPGLLYPFRSGGSGWKYATPINGGK